MNYPASILLALTIGVTPAAAEIEQCRFIQAKPEIGWQPKTDERVIPISPTLQQILLEVPLLGYIFAPKGTQEKIDRFKAWMGRKGRPAATFGAEPDIAEWANGCALNPARVDKSQRDAPAVQAARARLAEHAEPGLTRLSVLATEQSAEAEESDLGVTPRR